MVWLPKMGVLTRFLRYLSFSAVGICWEIGERGKKQPWDPDGPQPMYLEFSIINALYLICTGKHVYATHTKEKHHVGVLLARVRVRSRTLSRVGRSPPRLPFLLCLCITDVELCACLGVCVWEKSVSLSPREPYFIRSSSYLMGRNLTMYMCHWWHRSSCRVKDQNR